MKNYSCFFCSPKSHYKLPYLLLVIFFSFASISLLFAQTSNSKIPSTPLFEDPIFAGPADPTVFWNYEEENWWMIYTQRRANSNTPDLAWVHGTAIGVASSDDGGINWTYRGTLDLDYEPGHNTYWAPDLYYENGTYYMYVSFVRGIPTKNFDDEHKIILFTGSSMWDLSFKKVIDLQSARVIDPSVIKLSENKYRMWFKNENEGYTTHYADSNDLLNWTPKGQAEERTNTEGANVFRWQEKFWMITDPWEGIELLSSDNAVNWVKEGMILSEVGQRKDDTAKGHHADVVPAGEFAYVFYHVNPQESFGPTTSWDTIGFTQRRSVIQVARLRIEGDSVVVDRDQPFPLELQIPDIDP